MSVHILKYSHMHVPVCYAKIDKSRFIINPISTIQTAGTYGQVPLSYLRILDFQNGNMNHASVSSCVLMRRV